MAARTFFGTLRLALLVAVLGYVAFGAWLDRVRTRDWDAPLRVTIYPIAESTDVNVRAYAAALTAADFAPLGDFFARQSKLYGSTLAEPVRVRVSHAAAGKPPPALQRRPGLFAVMAWSLRVRWYAARIAWADPLPTPDIQVFATYDPADPAAGPVPDSVGLSKGLVAIAHLYADRTAAGSNLVVVAHELLHTLGASDKYDRATGLPLVPLGLGEPDRRPLFPQRYAEIMAGRIALNPAEAVIPARLDETVVGPGTALEIGWLK